LIGSAKMLSTNSSVKKGLKMSTGLSGTFTDGPTTSWKG
jgi:hypothetical protein